MMNDVKWLVFVFLVACGGTVSTGDDAAVTPDAAPLPLPVRCAQLAGAACDVATFPPACCMVDDDAGYLLRGCDAGAVAITSTCAP